MMHDPCMNLVVENPSHCDFVKLRTMLIRTHMHDLKDITGDCHYENYRAQCIQNMTRCVCVCVCSECVEDNFLCVCVRISIDR